MVYRIAIFLSLLSAPAFSMERIQSWCERGASAVVAPASSGGSPQNRKYQQSYPACTVDVFFTGTTTRATIYSDNSATSLANPFTADQYGHWYFYAQTGHYDVRISGGGLASPYTFGDITAVSTSFATDSGAKCNWNGSTGTDDTTALQAQITKVSATGGGVVVFQNYACSFSSTIRIPNNVKLVGGTAGQTSQGSRLVYTAAPSVPTPGLVFAGASPGNYTSGMSNINLQCSVASNANSIGLWVGGDPANVQAPSTYYGAQLRFEDNYIQGCGVGSQYGNHAFLNEWRGNVWYLNEIQVYAPVGITDAGDTEKYFGGLFTGGIQGGVKLAGQFEIYFYGTDFNFNANYQLNLDTTQLYCYGCNFEMLAQSGGAGAGLVATTWHDKEPVLRMFGGTMYYDCASTPQSEFINFDGAATVKVMIADMMSGSFTGCAPAHIISAASLSVPGFSTITLERTGIDLSTTTVPIVTNANNLFYQDLLTLGFCYGCNGSYFSGSTTRSGLQFNRGIPLLFGPTVADGGTNTSAFDVAFSHFPAANSMAVHSGPPNTGGIDQTLTPIYAGNWINTFSIPTATPALSTAIQGEIYQRSQGAFASGRQRICSGDPSQASFRTCMDLESNGGDPTHDRVLWYLFGAQAGTLTNARWYSGFGWASPIRTVATSASAINTDDTMLCNAAGGAVGLTLPAASAANAGRVYHFKKTDGSMNACSIGSAGGNIDGSGTVTLTTQNQTYTIQGDGTNWWIIAH